MKTSRRSYTATLYAYQEFCGDDDSGSNDNAVMTATTELRNPHFGYWVFRYGGVFILGSIGLIVASRRYWNQPCLLVPLALFIATTFFREPLLGTIIPTNAKTSPKAIIQNTIENQRHIVTIGDTLDSNTYVTDIQTKHITLKKNGQQRQLTLKSSFLQRR